MKTAPEINNWLIHNTVSYMHFRKSTLATLLYLLGGVAKGGKTCVELCDSDFPAFNDVLVLPESEQYILPFIDWQTESWKYDPNKRIAV